MRTLLTAALLALALTPAMAQDNRIAGTPVTDANTADVLDIMRVADAMSNAVDAKDWALVRSFTTDEIETSLGQSDVVTIPAEDMVAQFEKNLGDPSMASTHMRTNQRVFFDGPDMATMFSKGVIIATVTPGGEYAEDGGALLMENWVSYEHGFIRSSDGWKVNRILSEYSARRTTSLPGAE